MATQFQRVACVLAALLASVSPALSAGKDAIANKAKSGPSDAEKQAIETIRRLGGWVKQDKDGHVVEVNMVYHYTKDKKRLDNRNESAEALTVVSKFPGLKVLLLHGSQTTDAGLKHVRGLKHLERIYMWDAYKLTDAGIAHLKALKHLSYVHASNEPARLGPNVGLTDKSLEHLSKIKSLTGLALERNRITDAGLKHLEKLTKLTSLHLGLGPNKITDRGTVHLRGLKNLTKLGLQKTAITDAGLKNLAPLKHLQRLWIGQTKVTQEGIEDLQGAIPNLKVYYDKPQ
jgi:hypothetical protein